MSQALQMGIEEVYRARGAAANLFRLAGRAGEVVLSGPAGTGKSRACLEYLNYLAMEYPGCRLLMLRKTRRSLTESGMTTFKSKVAHDALGIEWNTTTQQYRYPNGSILAVGGMDKPGKIMSSEWDIIYVQEATELGEAEWEACTTRLRNGVVPWQQIIADCNPDAPTHWLKRRAESGKVAMLESRHEDNPALWDDRQCLWTEQGASYIQVLNELTGVRKDRLLHGRWAAAEGMVYEMWDRRLHIRPRFERTPMNLRGDPPREWPRYLSIDFGFSHPFVCLWWAQDPDGRLWCYREIYRTQRLVEDHAKDIKRLSRWDQKNGDPMPRLVICDHDAEGRAVLERHLGLMTLAANKKVRDGIQAVASRLRPSADGSPRLLFLQDTVEPHDIDLSLRDRKHPTCSVEEFESYVWARSSDGSYKEEPEKEYDHAMDAMRYMVADRDLIASWTSLGPKLF
jgi:phage terminase large subunit